jgi:hypothetical protein
VGSHSVGRRWYDILLVSVIWLAWLVFLGWFTYTLYKRWA